MTDKSLALEQVEDRTSVLASVIERLEGLIFAVSPASAKNAMAHVLETPEGPLRVIGIASAILGVVLVWLVVALSLGVIAMRMLMFTREHRETPT